MGSFFSWLKTVIAAILSLFFLFFGIETLIGAFHLKNPFEFIMFFFAASFMVLVSMVGVLYSLFQVLALFTNQEDQT